MFMEGTIECNGNFYQYRYVSKFDDIGCQHSYPVADINFEKEYYEHEDEYYFGSIEPPLYFAPLEILNKSSEDIVEWCEDHGMYFD